jgi:hypothetical protein
MVAIAEYLIGIDIEENTPAVLQTLPQWVCWRYDNVKGRQTKVPYDPNQTFARAKSNEPATWGTFDQALARYRKDGRFDGIAFNFSDDDPYAGIDLDDCLDPDTQQFTWGQDIVDAFASYTEISPSGTGVKIFIRGKLPPEARHVVKNMGANGEGQLELYDTKRFFIVTGRKLFDAPSTINDCQETLTSLCHHYWPPTTEAPSSDELSVTSKDKTEITTSPPHTDNRFNRCLAAMLAMTVQDQNDGSFRLYAAACRCVEHDLTDMESLVCLHAYMVQRPFPVLYDDKAILKRLRDAERDVKRGDALDADVDLSELIRGLLSTDTESKPQFLSVRQMMERYPELRPPIIHGLLREGETMNIIAAPKAGKSWLATDLAMSVATGQSWLNEFPTERGDVLILDNELHGETSAYRLPQVAKARGIDLSHIADTMFIENMRGSLQDVLSLRSYFAKIPPGRFKLIILDAFYRFMPADMDENDNGTMARLFNTIDSYAQDMQAAFVLIHHTTKGSQTGKAVTDVGAGAGAQSRASDTHLVLREHDEPGVMVLDAAVRSWPPIKPICLRREFPIWNPDPELDASNLARAQSRRKKAKAVEAEPKAEWTMQRVVDHFVTCEPMERDLILVQAMEAGLSKNRAKMLLAAAEAKGLIHPWAYGANRKVKLATIKPPENPADEGS